MMFVNTACDIRLLNEHILITVLLCAKQNLKNPKWSVVNFVVIVMHITTCSCGECILFQLDSITAQLLFISVKDLRLMRNRFVFRFPDFPAAKTILRWLN